MIHPSTNDKFFSFAVEEKKTVEFWPEVIPH